MLRSKLNGVDVGDTNYSREFAKRIDDNVYEIMKKDIRKNMNIKLDAIDKKRQAGLMMDKMPRPDLSAKSLAKSAKGVFNDAGFADEQLEGMGWDGSISRRE